jgi:hypothetical protein
MLKVVTRLAPVYACYFGFDLKLLGLNLYVDSQSPKTGHSITRPIQ